jgi:hypothetical protein
MEGRAWVVVFGLLVLLALGLSSLGEFALAGGLVLGWVLFGLLWALVLGDLLVPKMPECPGCGSFRTGYRWVGMRQQVSGGVFGNETPTWVLRNVEEEISVPVVVPDWKGSVLVCACPRYWFRMMDGWSAYLLTEHGPPKLFAQRRWGRWLHQKSA